MSKAIVALVLGLCVHFGAVQPALATMAEPAPSFDEPRRIVVSLNEKDEKRVNTVLSNVMNIQKFYGPGNVQLSVVVYGPGIWSILKNSPVRVRIESMQIYDIEFVACGNTLDAVHKTKNDMIDGVNWVQAGLVEIVERRLSGWVDLKP